MRQSNHPRMILQQVAREIATIGIDVPLIQCSDDGVVVDDPVAREIQQNGTLAQGAQTLGVDHVTSIGRERNMEGDEIRAREQIVDAQRRLHIALELPRTRNRNGRIIADDAHPERACRIGDLHPDRAETDDAQRTARQLEAHELLLTRLDRLVDGRVVALEPARKAPSLTDVARRDQHAGDHQLLDGVRISAGRIEDRHATRRHRLDRDVVGPGAGASDRQHTRRDIRRLHLGRAHQDGIRMRDLRGNLVAIPRQPIEPGNRDVVERLNFEH